MWIGIHSRQEIIGGLGIFFNTASRSQIYIFHSMAGYLLES